MCSSYPTLYNGVGCPCHTSCNVMVICVLPIHMIMYLHKTKCRNHSFQNMKEQQVISFNRDE